MNRKLTTTLILTIIFSTIIYSPVVNSYNINLLSYHQFVHQKILTSSPLRNISMNEKGKIKFLFNKAKNEIYARGDPSGEIKKILGFSEIKNCIEAISDDATTHIIYIIFSEKPILVKRLCLMRYMHILEKNRNDNHLFQYFESEYRSLLKKNITSIEDLEKINIISNFNLSAEDIKALYDYFRNYINNSVYLSSIFNNASNEFDIFSFFVYFLFWLIVYTFVFNGFIVTSGNAGFIELYHYMVSLLEGVILGVLGSGLLDLIQFHNLTIIEIISEFIYKYIPILEKYDRAVEEVISSLFAIVFIAVYISIFEFSDIVSFIMGGLFSLVLPLLMAAITYLILGPIGV